jgi:hypothetical protein
MSIGERHGLLHYCFRKWYCLFFLLFAVSQICDQGDLTGECVELAGLENLLDDLEICDSSLQWQSTVRLPSKEDSSFEDSVSLST